MLKGIDDSFTKSGMTVETYVSFMDMKRIPPTPQYFKQLKDLIKFGYKNIHFDAVLACDNDALNFIRQYRDELFPGIPVIFVSINNYSELMLDGRKDITGTSENTDYVGTIKIALKLCPKTNNVVVVIDDTTTGKAHRSAVEKIRSNFPSNLTFTYISLATMTMDELNQKLSQLGSNSIVLLLQHFIDKNGTSYTVQQSTPSITAHSIVPVFVVADSRMGLGTVGGNVVSGYAHGEIATQMVVKILKGTDIKLIPVMQNSHNKYIFDYNVMKRFNLAEHDLPIGSVVINKPVSMLKEFRPYLFTSICVVIILCGFIVNMLLEIRTRKQFEKSLEISKEKLSEAQRIAHVGSWELDILTHALSWSDESFRIFGFQKEVFSPTMEAFFESVHPDDRAMMNAVTQAAWNERKPFDVEHRIICPDGKILIVHEVAETVFDDAGIPIRMIGTVRDITEWRQAEELLRSSEEKYRAIIETTDTGYLIIDLQGNVVDANQEYVRLTGHNTLVEIIGRNVLEWTAEYEKKRNTEAVTKCLKDGQIRNFVIDYIDNAGQITPIEINATIQKEGDSQHIISLCRDITERRLADEEYAKIESKLKQAQKMESIGRLAGGVAHDFNNMLLTIMGNTDIAMDSISDDDPIQENLQEVYKAAERSADLTRQLLAFARKQTVSPKLLDLNDNVTNMLKMLQRLIGENIALVWQPGNNLGQIKIDPCQIDQVLANLCVNARDAISDVGKIIIETGISTFDEDYCSTHEDFIPGEYIYLSVSDNGCGMDKKTLENIFEPFFTTKAIGAGTGLGLASVYGAVKQNNGFIKTYSELGIGTSFIIYLPHYSNNAEINTIQIEESNLCGGETILLVEDDLSILKMITLMLEKLGYTVLAANTATDAIQMEKEFTNEIHLLLTDVVMPDMNGRDLLKILFSHRPYIKSLFMSGYTANVIAHHGVLDEGVQFIQKPFSQQQLSIMVREILNGNE